MKPLPLPGPRAVASHPPGRGRARVIRVLYANRCNFHEIECVTGVGAEEIRRTLHRPVRAKWAR